MRHISTWGFRCLVAGLLGTVSAACLPSGSAPTSLHSGNPFAGLLAGERAEPTTLPQPRSGADERVSAFDLNHTRVEQSVRRFQGPHRSFMRNALIRARWYLPTVNLLLAERGLPAELAYVPVIESGYRCNAVSKSGAVGPWQFIRSTGRRYGLTINRRIDERRDPIRSTQAAARYLADLYKRFGDWQLALAAYNGGEGQIQAALRRSGARSFWELAPHLPGETRRFVPRVLAAVKIAQAPRKYGFVLPSTPDCPPAALLASGERKGCVSYRVVRGDTLAAIARRYRVSLGTLQAHNRITNPRRLKPGRILLIPWES